MGDAFDPLGTRTIERTETEGPLEWQIGQRQYEQHRRLHIPFSSVQFLRSGIDACYGVASMSGSTLSFGSLNSGMTRVIIPPVSGAPS